MKVKKTVWIPIAIGMTSAALILAASEANFFIPLGNGAAMGIGELFTTLSAALGGPVASVITIFVVYSIHSILHPENIPDLPSLYILLEDAIAHLSAMLLVTLAYYKFLYPRMRNTGIFLTGWFLLVIAYYYLALLPLSVLFLNLMDPDQGATYTDFAQGFLPEVLGTAIITTLIWLASPVRYRRPLWIVPENLPDPNLGSPDELRK
jgi:hypothetical protein